MRRRRFAAAIPVVLGTAFFAVPAPASQPGDTEHGVDRAKLMAKAEQIVEERNGIDVQRISKCGPRRHGKKLDYSTWICMWRAEGTYADGGVHYACAGRAIFKRKTKTWIVDRCDNSRQPMAPLLTTPNPEPMFGFNDDWIFQPVAAFDLLDATGADIARTTLAWSGVEPTKGQFNWYGSDVMYQRLLERGIRPLWILLSAPCFAQAEPGACQAGKGNGRPRPDSYDAMAQFAVTAAKRYPQSIGFEVWNEPNYPRFWGGPPDPAAYSDMLSTVADTMHDEVPGMTVVSAGLSPHADTDTSGSIGFRDFLIGMYEHGAAQKADAIGIHPYPGVGPNEDYLTDVRVYLGKVENVMDRYGDGDRPLWATEFGASTGGDKAFSPEQAGKAITQLLDMFRYIRGIQVTIIHSFVDPSLGGREGGFGLLNKDLTPKPAFCDVAAYRGLDIPICD